MSDWLGFRPFDPHTMSDVWVCETCWVMVPRLWGGDGKSSLEMHAEQHRSVEPEGGWLNSPT